MIRIIKDFVKSNFQSFSYFYGHLKYRIFLSLVVSLFVGTLDGLGLAMFIPLLKMVDTSGSQSAMETDELGNLSFLVESIESIGISINLFSILLTILIFFSLKGVFKFFQGYLKVVYQQYFIKRIRIGNANLLANYKYSEYVKSNAGRIQNTFTGEVNRVNLSFSSYFMTVQAAVLVGVYVTLAFLSNPQFALLITIGGVCTNFIFKKLYFKTKKKSRLLTEEMHEFQGLLIQKIINFKYLKATSLIFKYVEKLKIKINNIEITQRKIGILNAILQAIREPLTMLIVVIVIIIQVEFLSGKLNLIILSLLFFYRALTFLMSMQSQWNTFLSVSGSLENMEEFTQELKAGQEKFGVVKLNTFKDKISIKDLSFSYNEKNVLSNINFEISKNDTIAIVGESGAGKTTLINILVGLIKPTGGAVYIDSTNYNQIDIRSLQSRVGYITQEPVIFSDTIFNNVTFWAEKNEVNILRFNQAMEDASLTSFLNDLPENKDAYLGNNGINLSGGQKQRISIARELYKDMDILVMDEATSSLDSETEFIIQENIENLIGRYTFIIVAHRLSTIKNANKIILLNGGKIDDMGSFEELMAQSAVFQRMVNFQNFS
jgi:ABC-type multidrug transport system fused ATPase/permease subunit